MFVNQSLVLKLPTLLFTVAFGVAAAALDASSLY